ncbi:hypothetical protein IAT40_007258 [Kwoniella sp. CBS 6097]
MLLSLIILTNLLVTAAQYVYVGCFDYKSLALSNWQLLGPSSPACRVEAHPPSLRYDTGNQASCSSQIGAPSNVTVRNFLQCSSRCAGYPNSAEKHHINNGSATCACLRSESPFDDGRSSTCLYGDWYLYPRTSLPSGMIRRQHRFSVNGVRDEALPLPYICPGGMSACKVLDGDDMSYECLDVQQEIESCGGCMNGEFRREAHRHSGDSSRGIDCTKLPSVDPRGVTCSQGRCLAYVCEDGFVLQHGACQAA